MKKLILSGLAGLLAIAVVGTPVAVRAQISTNTLAEKKAAAAEKKTAAVTKLIPFRGKVKAIDNNAKTLSVGKETFQITSGTKIIKMGKPATLADGAEGDQVGGQYKKDTDGKLIATSVRFGPKAPGDTSSDAKMSKETKTKKP
jgi:hypothetical protein